MTHSCGSTWLKRLSSEGYKTSEAADADEAIALLEANPKIRVVFTDIQMPGTMDGLALSRYVRKRWPPTIIVVSSGRCPPTGGRDGRAERCSSLSHTRRRCWAKCWMTSVSGLDDASFSSTACSWVIAPVGTAYWKRSPSASMSPALHTTLLMIFKRCSPRWHRRTRPRRMRFCRRSWCARSNERVMPSSLKKRLAVTPARRGITNTQDAAVPG